MKKLILTSFALAALTLAPPAPAGDDFLWLEEVEGERALGFAKEQSKEALKALRNDSRFSGLEQDVRAIMLAEDRMPAVSLMGGRLYNFWQDEVHVRGIWRRTTLRSFRSRNPRWEVLLDLDKLAAEEGENWVWKGASCRQPQLDRCLIRLSRGGKDASVRREFDLGSRSFVRGGFFLPEAKSSVSWLSRDALYVATDFGEGTLTDSGYPLVVKAWKRGEPLSEAVEVFRGQKEDVSASSYVDVRPEGSFQFLFRNRSFYESEVWWRRPEKELLLLPMPADADFGGAFHGYFLFTLRSELEAGDRSFAPGSLVALPIGAVEKGKDAATALELVFAPTDELFLRSTSRVRSKLLLGVLDRVKGRILQAERKKGGWELSSVPLGENGMAGVYSTEADSDSFLASYADFLTPTTIYAGKTGALRKLRAAPARFDAAGLLAEQREATSRDGTKVPYFLVRREAMAFDGSNPTLLYGYGGFRSSLTPWYSGVTGKAWLERGGAFVIANIRGGGEFGPLWHQAALRENRQRSFDDFIAVAEDLIRLGVTSSAQLGIQGGSNGGLLVGAVFVQRPELFNAVLCEVPLLDMLRYHKLLAGASWMEEYGDPEDPAMREAIAKYSPFQNVKKGVKYPEVFFLTSTKDDRVHPGHARRMVARMRKQGHPVLYYENTEGGHGGAANLEQRILWSALEFTYLWRQLGAR
jgi:prolyl oligopeptidase